jgi:large subunit ribosomal protein L21
MYAVVSSGGKQYRVEPGSTLLMERLSSQLGASILFDRVLLIGDGDAVTVGTPVVAGASVTGTILGEELGPKLVIFKFKQKVKYRRRTGHRQHLLRVRIDEINSEGRPKAAAKPRASRARAKAEPEASVKAEPEASVQAEPEASVQADTETEKPKPRRRAPAKPKTEKAEKAEKAETAEKAEE